MTKLLLGFTFLSILLVACRREIEPLDLPTTQRIQAKDTIKAIVFDGPLDPAFPTFNYDSLVFSINNTSSTIIHYDRAVPTATEHLSYDNQGRVTSYRVDWDASNYRHVYYSYNGTGKVPVLINDTLYDSQLMHFKLTLLQTNTVGNGKERVYREEYVTTGFSDMHDLKVYFDGNERILRDVNEDNSGFEECKTYYSNGLVDSSLFKLQRPAGTDSSGLFMKYTAYDSPLHRLSALLYKNVAPYTMTGWGWFGQHLALSVLPDGIFEPKLPKSTRYATGGTVFFEYSYNYQFQDQNLTGITIQSQTFPQSQTSRVNVRIY